MCNVYFFTGREQELRDLIDDPAHLNLDMAACAGADPDGYHPDEGQPDEVYLSCCTSCPARLACLALALRAEDSDARAGWYGGLGPIDRDIVAMVLHLKNPNPPPKQAVEAAQLQASGWTVNQIAMQLGYSRRTIQRYLRIAA